MVFGLQTHWQIRLVELHKLLEAGLAELHIMNRRFELPGGSFLVEDCSKGSNQLAPIEVY